MTSVTKQFVDLISHVDRPLPSKPPYTTWPIEVLSTLVWHARFVAGNDTLLRDVEDALREHLLEISRPYGEGPALDVPRVRPHDLEPSQFKRIYRNHPVVVEGLLSDTVARRTWSLDSFRERFGDCEVPCAKQVATDDLPYEEMNIGRLIDSIRSRSAQKYYLMASSTLFASNESLLRELDVPRLERFSGKKCIRAEIFIGGTENGSPFHCAQSGNLFCNVHGHKAWLLVSPQHSMWMYPQIGRNRLAVYVNSPILSDRTVELGNRFPLFQYVPKYRVVLQPGDVLYVPPWWWHEVRNLDETIGVPVRLLDEGGGNLPFALLMLTMMAVSPKSALQLLPVMRNVLQRSLSRDGNLAGLYLSDGLTRLSHVTSRLYDRGWRLRDVQPVPGAGPQTVAAHAAINA